MSIWYVFVVITSLQIWIGCRSGSAKAVSPSVSKAPAESISTLRNVKLADSEGLVDAGSHVFDHVTLPVERARYSSASIMSGVHGSTSNVTIVEEAPIESPAADWSKSSQEELGVDQIRDISILETIELGGVASNALFAGDDLIVPPIKETSAEETDAVHLSKFSVVASTGKGTTDSDQANISAAEFISEALSQMSVGDHHATDSETMKSTSSAISVTSTNDDISALIAIMNTTAALSGLPVKLTLSNGLPEKQVEVEGDTGESVFCSDLTVEKLNPTVEDVSALIVTMNTTPELSGFSVDDTDSTLTLPNRFPEELVEVKGGISETAASSLVSAEEDVSELIASNNLVLTTKTAEGKAEGERDIGAESIVIRDSIAANENNGAVLLSVSNDDLPEELVAVDKDRTSSIANSETMGTSEELLQAPVSALSVHRDPISTTLESGNADLPKTLAVGISAKEGGGSKPTPALSLGLGRIMGRFLTESDLTTTQAPRKKSKRRIR